MTLYEEVKNARNKYVS
jgi:uncharacterized small protein (DUF1192 family)